MSEKSTNTVPQSSTKDRLTAEDIKHLDPNKRNFPECIWPDCRIKVDGLTYCEHGTCWFTQRNTRCALDPIQNNCKYGYALPDYCRYNSRTGCDCGAYPPVKYE